MLQRNHNDQVPFEIAKVLVVRGMQPTDVRGQHAHRCTAELVVPISGGCTVECDNGQGDTESFELRSSSEGMYLPPQYWRTLKDFEKGTVLLIVADTEYSEADYIRDYDDFLSFVNNS